MEYVRSTRSSVRISDEIRSTRSVRISDEIRSTRSVTNDDRK